MTCLQEAHPSRALGWSNGRPDGGRGGRSLGGLRLEQPWRVYPQSAHEVTGESARLIREVTSHQPQPSCGWWIRQISVPFSFQARWARLEEHQPTPGLMG